MVKIKDYDGKEEKDPMDETPPVAELETLSRIKVFTFNGDSPQELNDLLNAQNVEIIHTKDTFLPNGDYKIVVWIQEEKEKNG